MSDGCRIEKQMRVNKIMTVSFLFWDNFHHLPLSLLRINYVFIPAGKN